MVFMILIGKRKGLTWDCEDEGKESNGWHSRAV